MAVSHDLERVPVAQLANGHELELVIHRIRGGEDGPTLGLVGGIHGDEPLGVETVRRVVTDMGEAGFRGSVVALPVANPYGFQALTRNAPIDMANLNRVFPGNPDGMLSEQLAHTICERFLPGCDYLIDFHSGGNLATVDYAYLHDDEGLGRAFGCELLFAGPSYGGTLGDYARRKGVPTVVPELGGGQQLNDKYLAKGVRGARNVMKVVGMLDGEPELPSEQRIVHDVEILRPHHGGLLLSAVDATRLGEAVAGGTELGRVVSPYTFEVLEVLRAPYDPSLLVLVREHVTKVDPGEFGFIVANGATAEPA